MSSSQTASRWGYSYDPTTREYIGPVRLVASPLDGTYPLPAYTVTFAPVAALDSLQQYRLDPAGMAWEAVADYRGLPLFKKETAEQAVNTLVLGDEVPDDLTVEKPAFLSWADCQANAWDSSAQAWKIIPDYSTHTLWNKQTGETAEPLARGEPLPDDLTTLAPPSGPHIAGQWDETANQWNAVPDFRGSHYWTADGEFHVINEIGIALPEDALLEPPNAAPLSDTQESA